MNQKQFKLGSDKGMKEVAIKQMENYSKFGERGWGSLEKASWHRLIFK